MREWSTKGQCPSHIDGLAHRRDKEEVEGKEGEGIDVGVLLETVKLHA